jgi:hypothetical protein
MLEIANTERLPAVFGRRVACPTIFVLSSRGRLACVVVCGSPARRCGARCTYYGEYGLRCFLQCRDGAICPDGMSCVDVLQPNEGGEYDHICIWPAA